MIFDVLKKKKQMLIITVCFSLEVIFTQFMNCLAWDNPSLYWGKQSTDLLMAVVIISFYSFADIKKRKALYLSYFIVGAIAAIAYCVVKIPGVFSFERAAVVVKALGICLIGFCIIHTVISLFIEKKKVKLYIPSFAVWVLLFVFMAVSVNGKDLMPLRYLLIFLCFYLTPQTEEQRTDSVEGMLNGIILGFLFEFSFALLFRPYDRVRYLGNFSNPNENCLFLCFVLAALFGRILFSYYRGEKKAVSVILHVLVGAVYTCIYMTSCRTGYFVTAILFCFYIVFCFKRFKKPIVKSILTHAVIFIVALPLTYCAIRYVPLTNSYVKFYYYDNHMLHSVHKENKKDPKNYITFEEMLFNPLGRLKIMFVNDANADAETETVTAKEVDEKSAINPLAPKGSPDNPYLSAEEMTDPILVRSTIYKWYFEHLNLRGNLPEERGFQLSADSWNGHAHNIYLEYGSCYGIPAMVCLVVFVFFGGIRSLVKTFKKKDTIGMAMVLAFFVVPIFGLLEYSWGFGLLWTNAFYFAAKAIVTEPVT